MKTSYLLLGFLFLTGACSKVRDFENKTKSMEKTTRQLSDKTDEMGNTTSNMYTQLRSKEAEDTRNQKFLELMDKDIDMGSKFSAAAVFYKSFEFQLWTNEGDDDYRARTGFFLDAVNEFTRRLCDIYKDLNPKRMSPSNEKKRHNSQKAFYALAATIHINNHFQEELVKKHSSVKLTSFYDLVKKALSREASLKSLEIHEEVLLSGINREMMIELIKARVDILAGLALRNLTDKRDMTFGQKTKGILFKITGGRLGSIDLPEIYDQSNDATKHMTEIYLDGAIKAQQFLRDIGVDKRLEKTLNSAFKKIDFNEKPVSGDEPEQFEDKDLRRARIRNMIESLVR